MMYYYPQSFCIVFLHRSTSMQSHVGQHILCRIYHFTHWFLGNILPELLPVLLGLVSAHRQAKFSGTFSPPFGRIRFVWVRFSMKWPQTIRFIGKNWVY